MSAECPPQLASALAASDLDQEQDFTPPKIKRYKNRSFLKEGLGTQSAQASDRLQVQVVDPPSGDARASALNPALPVLPLARPCPLQHCLVSLQPAHLGQTFRLRACQP